MIIAQAQPTTTHTSRTGIIDCDVHPIPRSTDEIRGYMPMIWRDRYSGGGRGFFSNPVHGMRLDSKPPDGPTGSDPDFLRRQLIDEYGIAYAILLPRAFCNLHPAVAPVARPADSDRDYFAETGHTLGGSFRQFWCSRGSLPLFGLPLSEEFREVNPQDGKPYIWPVAAFPATPGNIMIAGHAGFKDTIFNHLPDTTRGDEIIVSIGQAERRYRVTEIWTVGPDDAWVMAPLPRETLTLIICVPIDLYSHRLIVRAMPSEP
jgi:hypothetical protein